MYSTVITFMSTVLAFSTCSVGLPFGGKVGHVYGHGTPGHGILSPSELPGGAVVSDRDITDDNCYTAYRTNECCEDYHIGRDSNADGNIQSCLEAQLQRGNQFLVWYHEKHNNWQCFGSKTCNNPKSCPNTISYDLNHCSGYDVTCSVWPSADVHHICSGGGKWKQLNISLEIEDTASCKTLCTKEAESGCCYLGNTDGCYWSTGGVAVDRSSQYNVMKGSAVTCNSLGPNVTCSPWPKASPNYSCSEAGKWKELDRSLGLAEKASCLALCTKQGASGCCRLSDEFGCFWQTGSIAVNHLLQEKGRAITCKTTQV